LDRHYISGSIQTKVGQIPQVPAVLSKRDKWQNLKVRLDIGRMRYRVEPGLYAVGNPDPQSVVLVTANFKLSFDTLRKELGGLDAWILVLDTHGINVWCAAGKGTFATAELVKRIEVSGLKEVVKHHKLIVPQLGAVGVSAHRVRKESGFLVIYGPVRAADLAAFLEAGNKAIPEMRQVRFNVSDRLLIVPIEFVEGFKQFFLISLVFFVIAGFTGGSKYFLLDSALLPVLYLALAYLAGTVMAPLLLPWLPGRSFSFKGAIAGVIVFAAAYFAAMSGTRTVEIAAWLLVIPAVTSFIAMNFTGASTYTSLSGVKKEMRYAIPFQVSAVSIGCLLWLSARFHFI
jgi:acetyl-CoA decarbonylase/synthase complex subunit gamma